MTDIRVTLAIGFALVHKDRKFEDIEVNQDWPRIGVREPFFKTPTILQYDADMNAVKWGFQTINRGPGRGKRNDDKHLRMVELFKLYLSEDGEGNRRRLPDGLKYEQAITDYLRHLKKEIMSKIDSRWPGLEYYSQVRLILSVPAEWGPTTKNTMRQCCLDAGLIDDIFTNNLEFTTERELNVFEFFANGNSGKKKLLLTCELSLFLAEAAAIYCMEYCKDYSLKEGDTFTVVDCGGGTVDVTTRELLAGDRLGEITESKGDCCGGSYVDLAFLRYIANKLFIPWDVMENVMATYASAIKYFLEALFWPVKYSFTGKEEDFYELLQGSFEIDIEEALPILRKYVPEEYTSELDEYDWVIVIGFGDVKAMFDGVIDRILKLVGDQLESAPKEVSAVFLVGGFGENKYVQSRIKEAYSKPGRVIAVPVHPITAIVRGAAMYGLNFETNKESPYYGINRTVQNRMLKFTYGTEISSEWKPGDPITRRTSSNRIVRFCCLARRGTQIDVTNKFTDTFGPVNPNQTKLPFNLYYTSEYDATYVDDENMYALGKWSVLLNDVRLGLNRPVEFSLSFGTSEIRAVAINKRTGEMYHTTFEFPE
ncbi:6848_t:CDS:10 [Paraglomus occultum]|uniref:6848_t:CDS:1 n=1 Tax=Paraglomus occultum TaxID=144539 RepID=A0A9N9ALS7_9GLOM|nr:6848_t:CDS:10 [Paraglomus occultum]